MSRSDWARYGSLAIGLTVLTITLIVPAPGGMPAVAWQVVGVAGLMAAWWIGEALPVPATALVPLVAFPLFQIAPIKAAAAPYANPLIFLFLGGFAIAQAFEKWGLHKRIALAVLARVGTRPAPLIAGFMLASAGLSMWVSNTATAVMMLPIALSVIALLHQPGVAMAKPETDRNFAIALLLGIAYGASIGGLATLIGTPPNALLAGYMREASGLQIGFGQWMLIGLPAVVILLPITWFLLTRLIFPMDRARISGADAVLRQEIQALGPMSPAEKRVAAIFLLTAGAWIARSFLNKAFPGLGLSDPAIAIAGTLALFVLPSGGTSKEADRSRLFTWADMNRISWGVLLLLGGGLSLAAAIGNSGLAEWISQQLVAGQDVSGWTLVLTFTGAIVFLTELTSNTATAAAFLPIVAQTAADLGIPAMMLLVPVTLAASCAFMMPVATPPNAVIFGSGYIRIPDMIRAGFWLNLIAITVICALALILVPAVFTP